MNKQIKELAKQAGFISLAIYNMSDEIERFYEFAFEAGRMVGFKQDKALTELARIGQELEQAEKQEPVAWEYQEYRSAFMGNLQWFDTVQFVQPPNDPELFRNIKPLYIEPPRKEWVGLTDEDVVDLYCQVGDETEWAIGGLKDAIPFANLVEAKLKERNT